MHTLIPLIEGSQIGKRMVCPIGRDADVRGVIRPVLLLSDDTVGVRDVIMSDDVHVELSRHFPVLIEKLGTLLNFNHQFVFGVRESPSYVEQTCFRCSVEL